MSTKKKKASHPEHPVRNFFMMLLCLLFLVGFSAMWYALDKTDMPNRIYVLYGGMVLTGIGILVGILAPLIKAIQYGNRRK